MPRFALALLATIALLFAFAGSAGAQDVDCDEVSYARAQEILAQDPSDPHDLDRDNDGEACENGAGGSGNGSGGGATTTGGGDTAALPAVGTGSMVMAGSTASMLAVVASLLLITGTMLRRTSLR